MTGDKKEVQAQGTGSPYLWENITIITFGTLLSLSKTLLTIYSYQAAVFPTWLPTVNIH